MRATLSACCGTLTALLLTPLTALAQQSPPGPAAPEGYYWRPGPWNMMWSDGYGWHGWWMFPVMLVFLVLAVAAVVHIGHAMTRRGTARPGDWDDPALPALRILNERFARGDIGREEFEEKKAVLLFGGRR